MAPGDDVVAAVEAHLAAALGEPSGRASVTVLGTEPLDVLRFGPTAGPEGEPLVRYATLGMSRHPMHDPADLAPDPVRGPRAELLLTVREPVDDVLRTLAVLAAAPSVEGLVIQPGASVDLQQPLWPGAAVSAVLVGEPGGLVPDLPLPPPADPVRFVPVLPMTAHEAAWKRVHGAAALEERWLAHGTDLRDPRRRGVPLGVDGSD